ncbi:MAG: rhodanese-related sulfurtransferase [Arenicella sp.]|jgi:rhodanese-related sulfurtransferase
MIRKNSAKISTLAIATSLLVALLFIAIPANAELIDLDHDALSDKQKANSSLVIIDVRSAQEFASGHVPGAINIAHLSILNDVTLLDRYKDQEMVFYCRSGRRAKSVTDALESSDYTSGRPLYQLEGDILGWIAADQPLQKLAL